MSRIAKQPIEVPGGVDVTIDGSRVAVKGPLGALEFSFNSAVRIVREGNVLRCQGDEKTPGSVAQAGTARAVLANMVHGVAKGFERRLTLVGVGYRAQLQGNKLNLSLGYSHPIEHELPAGIKAEVPQPTEIVLKGADKQQLGQQAAKIRGYRPPEPYKGKGVRYADEIVVLKETKKK